MNAGRHSSPEQGPFYRSIVAWALPWLVMAAFVIVAVYIAVDVVGKDDEKIPVAAPSASREPQEEPSDEPVDTPEPEASRSEPTPQRTPKAEESKELITEDITIQVLNGTAATDADDRMASRLTDLGFEVVAVQGSSKHYPSTTVFWSFPGAREAAERLADRFGWVAAERPSNLSSQVDLHVVVGSDEA